MEFLKIDNIFYLSIYIYMIELFSLLAATEYFQNKKEYFNNTYNHNENPYLENNFLKKYNSFPDTVPITWVIVILLISFGTAYLAYCCNQYENQANRAVMTIIAFFFSGFYLIYYFVYHVLLNKDCGSRSITNIVTNIVKKKK